VSDAGAYHAYPTTGARAPGDGEHPAGPYRTPAYEYEALALATHKPPLGAYRGVGMTMGAFVIERLARTWSRRAPLSTRPRCGGAISSRASVSVHVGDRVDLRQRRFPTALEQVLAAVEYRSCGASSRRAGGRRAVGIASRATTEYTGWIGGLPERGMTDVPHRSGDAHHDPDATVRAP